MSFRLMEAYTIGNERILNDDGKDVSVGLPIPEWKLLRMVTSKTI